jgi:hypothetical protein
MTAAGDVPRRPRLKKWAPHRKGAMLGWAEVELSSGMIVNKLRLLCAQTRSKFLKPLAEMYASLDPDLRRAIGAHDFPARPIPIIGGEQCGPGPATS